MTIELDRPEELREGQEAYLHYLGGVALLIDPESTFSRGLHQRELEQDSMEAITLQAETLMYNGLQSLILAASPTGQERYHNLYAAEHRFKETLPIMRHVIDQAYDQHRERIDSINPAFFGLQPLPIANNVIYRQLCHRRLYNLSTVQLLDGFQPAVFFSDSLKNRTLKNIARRNYRHYADKPTRS